MVYSLTESLCKLLSLTCLYFINSWSEVWRKHFLTPTKFGQIHHTWPRTECVTCQVYGQELKTYIILNTCDSVWMMQWGAGGKVGGGIMFLPVLAPQPDTLYNHCFLSTVLIKMTLKLSHISVAKSSGQLATRWKWQDDVSQWSGWTQQWVWE